MDANHNSNHNRARRSLCRSAGAALVLIPILAVCGKARGATNNAQRATLHYQDHPNETKSCDNCLEYVATVGNPKVGTCKVIPGDDEISVNGYCDAWNTM